MAKSILAIITEVVSSGYPDQSLPGDQPYPDQSLPGDQPVPTHPIYLPGEGGVPTHPINLPPYVDNSLPGDQPRPDQSLPGDQPRPDQSLPGDQPVPTHPIVIPPGETLPPEAGEGFEVYVGWTEEQGWVVVLVPQFEHVTPSKKK